MSSLNNGTTDSTIVELQLARNAVAKSMVATASGKDVSQEQNNGQKDQTLVYAQNNQKPIMDQRGPQRDTKYQELVDELTPKHNLFTQMWHAFFIGGLVCVLGQFIINRAMDMGLKQEDAGSWCSLLLILISIILTGLNLFSPIAKWAGAGILVPITGFANGVASSAIEFQKEGQVFGIGCKIFTIAGPVILYGLVSSWVLGLVYWLGTLV